MKPEHIISANSLRPIKNRLVGPVTSLSEEMLQAINERIGKRQRSRYLFDEWFNSIDTEGKSLYLRGSPSELNRIIFSEPIAGRHYCFVALKPKKRGELGHYQIWEITPST